MNEMLTCLQVHAAPLFDTWLIMQLQTGAFILLVFAIDALMKSASPRTRYLLWMTALVKAFIPPVLALPSGGSVTAIERVTMPVLEVGTGVLAVDGPAGLSAFSMMLALLLLCALLFTGLVLLRGTALRLRLRNAVPFAHDAWRHGPPVFVSGRIASPLAVGLRHPRIFITPDIAAAPTDILHAVLHHEYAHIRRRDQVTVYLQTLIQIFSVLNPLVWLMNTRLFRYREQICDAEALERAETRPQDYGRLLLDFASDHPARVVQVGTCFFETRRGFVQRINHLFSQHRNGAMKWTQRIAVSICIFLVAPLSWKCSDNPKMATYTIHSEESVERKLLDSSGKEHGSLKLGDPVFSKVTYEKVGELRTGHGPEIVGGLNALSRNVGYPEQAQEKGVEGTVVVLATVNRDGPPDYTHVISSVHPLLDEAAVEAVKSTRFKAARRNGLIQKGDITIPIRFQLQ